MSGAPPGENYVPPGEREELLAEVASCDSDADAAQKAADSQRLLVCLERGLHLRRRLFVESSSEVTAACRRLCEACNFAATTMLQKENLKGAHELLKRAEEVAEKSDIDRAITWNNLACYYKRVGKLRVAVSFLERALAVEEHSGNADAAQTHLNLCATLSQLQRHTDALYHAQCALIRVYEILAPLMLSGDLTLPPAGGKEGGGDAHPEQVTVLCIAYHNLAVEHEYLKNFESAVCAYAEGLRWAGRFLAPGHQLLGILSESVEAIKAKLPPNSGAAKRATDVIQGLNQQAAQSDSEQLGAQETELMTPRGSGDGGGRQVDDENEASLDESGLDASTQEES